MSRPGGRLESPGAPLVAIIEQMTTFGYFLSCEYTPAKLLSRARLAEEAGFDALWISDHFHPWTSEQGESPFVWSMIGAISQVCDLPVTTAVTCPTLRIHPAIIAQAAATSALLLGEGRFCLGLGSGEALNEHILGDVWPAADTRLEMLEGPWRSFGSWTGATSPTTAGTTPSRTPRIWSLPTTPPRISISGFGPKATDLAARIGDAYTTTTPDRGLLDRFRQKAKDGATAQAGLKVAWADTEDEGWDHIPDLAECRSAV